jgi:hypothetical protein
LFLVSGFLVRHSFLEISKSKDARTRGLHQETRLTVVGYRSPMQRSALLLCQDKKSIMKIAALLLLIFVIGSCNKQGGEYYIDATVVDGQGCYPGSRAVRIDRPLTAVYTFLCKDASPTDPNMNCGNTVYITNMPASLAVTGQKIKFMGWTIKVSCFSSTTAPNHIEVKDIKAR